MEKLLGEHEVALRKLTPPLSDAELCAGAAVIGDGRVGLFLRLESLLGKKGGAEGSAPAAAKPAAKPRILLVDDSLTSRMLLKAMLSGAGYEVVPGGDGQEAMEILEGQEGKFDAIVSDIEMPKMNGLEFAAQAKSNEAYKKIPFILISTLDSPEDRQKGLDAGADDYVVKGSLRQNALVEALKKLLQQKA